MNALKLTAAIAVFAAAGSAFAADAPAATATTATERLSIPSVLVTDTAGRTRAEVHAEAVEFVKNYKNTLQAQLDDYRNY